MGETIITKSEARNSKQAPIFEITNDQNEER